MAFLSLSTPPLHTSLRNKSQNNVCRIRRGARKHHSNNSYLNQRAIVTAHKAREVSAEELEVALQENVRPMLIDAFATWCGPCQFLIPQLDLVADKFGDRLDILKFNTELYPDLATTLQVRGLPTLFFVKDCKLRYRMEGALSAEELEKAIEYILFDGPAPVEASQAPAA